LLKEVYHNHGALGRYQHLSSLVQGLGVRVDRRWWGKAGNIGQGYRLGQGVLLDRGVQAYIDGSLGLRHSYSVSPEHSVNGAGDAIGLVIPFDIVPHRIALDQGGMYPVDPRTATLHSHGASTPQDEDGSLGQPRIIDGIGCIEQTYNIVHNGGHGPPGRQPVASSQRDGNVLVVAEDHLGVGVASIVDQGIMKATEGCTRVQRYILDVQSPEQIYDDVRAILGLGDIWDGYDSVHGLPPSEAK
jgi:hypothetical protein